MDNLYKIQQDFLVSIFWIFMVVLFYSFWYGLHYIISWHWHMACLWNVWIHLLLMICWAPREVLKPLPFRLRFQHLPRGQQMLMHRKSCLIPILLKILTYNFSIDFINILYFCRTCMGDLGMQVSVCLSIRPSICLSVRQHLPWVSCERNSSYSFLLIFLKLCRCFLHGVRMCMWFGYNCWIIFYHFFHFVNLVIFRPQCINSGYLVSATPHTILYQSFRNFAHVFSMVWRCAYGLDIILELIFVTFSTLWTL